MMNYTETFQFRGKFYNKACRDCPEARHRERAVLLDRLGLEPGSKVCDVPAGGGYLTEAIARSDDFDITCVEPSADFAQEISPKCRVLHNSMDCIAVPDGSFTHVGSLAGLHHESEHQLIFREWYRILQPGGRLAVADVLEGSDTARFLNTFVDRYTPDGHAGVFFEERRLGGILESCGFADCWEELHEVPWLFESEHQMIRFCRDLFFLRAASDDVILRGIERYLGYAFQHGKVAMSWQLLYVTANRPPANRAQTVL